MTSGSNEAYVLVALLRRQELVSPEACPLHPCDQLIPLFPLSFIIVEWASSIYCAYELAGCQAKLKILVSVWPCLSGDVIN